MNENENVSEEDVEQRYPPARIFSEVGRVVRSNHSTERQSGVGRHCIRHREEKIDEAKAPHRSRRWTEERKCLKKTLERFQLLTPLTFNGKSSHKAIEILYNRMNKMFEGLQFHSTTSVYLATYNLGGQAVI